MINVLLLLCCIVLSICDNVLLSVWRVVLMRGPRRRTLKHRCGPLFVMLCVTVSRWLKAASEVCVSALVTVLELVSVAKKVTPSMRESFSMQLTSWLRLLRFTLIGIVSALVNSECV